MSAMIAAPPDRGSRLRPPGLAVAARAPRACHTHTTHLPVGPLVLPVESAAPGVPCTARDARGARQGRSEVVAWALARVTALRQRQSWHTAVPARPTHHTNHHHLSQSAYLGQILSWREGVSGETHTRCQGYGRH